VESGLFDHIAISSDSDAIIDAGLRAGATIAIRRPEAMATDEAGKMPAIAHAVQQSQIMSGKRYTTCVDLDATSPLRLASDIAGAVKMLEESRCSNVITAAPARHSPYFNLIELDEKGHVRLSKKLSEPVLRRQDSPACYDMNGSIYVWQSERLLTDPRVFYNDTKLFIMPRERSIDIDDEVDWSMVELLMKQRTNHG
jgi:N-acylneuraminate cytidylyltransferase/CMP-N,N'-diacetyllegionaminic acid synthase